MGKIKLYYDEKGKTLSVWFDAPEKEVISEEVGDGVNKRPKSNIRQSGGSDGADQNRRADRALDGPSVLTSA